MERFARDGSSQGAGRMPERPLRILELRTVRGTGGGPEKTILLGSARTDPSRYAITVCYIRDERDPVYHIDRRAENLPVDYVEVRERNSFDPRNCRVFRSAQQRQQTCVRLRNSSILKAHAVASS